MIDINKHSFADVDGKDLSGKVFGENCEAVYSDILKFSHASNITGRGVKIRANGAKENAIDCNRACKNISLELDIEGGRQCGIVVKGGCTNIVLEIVRLIRDPNSCYAKFGPFWFEIDAEIDGWSDQNQEQSGVTLINKTGKTLVYTFGRGGNGPCLIGPWRHSWVLTVGLHAYNLFKGWGLLK